MSDDPRTKAAAEAIATRFTIVGSEQWHLLAQAVADAVAQAVKEYSEELNRQQIASREQAEEIKRLRAQVEDLKRRER